MSGAQVEHIRSILVEHEFMPCSEHSATVHAWWAQCEGCDWKGPRRSRRGHQADHLTHVAETISAELTNVRAYLGDEA